MRSPEQSHEAYIPFEEVETAVEIYYKETLDYDRAMFMLEVSEDPRDNTVEDGKLITQDGTAFEIPTEDDIVTLQAQKDAADQKLRAAIGLPEKIDIGGFLDVVSGVSLMFKRIANKKRIAGEDCYIDPYLSGSIGRDLHHDRKPIRQFFADVQTLARITGDTYPARSSALACSCADIGPSTDIEELTEKARNIDEEVLEIIRASQVYDEELKQNVTKEVRLAYSTGVEEA